MMFIWIRPISCITVIKILSLLLCRSPDSVCLENRPSIGGVVSPGGNGDNGTAGGGLLLPGMEYTPTEQCQLQHGNQSTHCTGMQVRGS